LGLEGWRGDGLEGIMRHYLEENGDGTYSFDTDG
jgi:hypothetical protein